MIVDSIASKICLKDDRNTFKMTTKQFFLFFRVYNVPIYVLEKTHVHFKDVAIMLAKIAIENKYNLKNSLKLSSKRIETALNDMWTSKYPSKCHHKSDYIQISDKYDKLAHAGKGKVFLGFDIMTWQACRILQDNAQRARAIRLERMMRMNYIRSLMSKQPVDNRNRYKINELEKETIVHNVYRELNEVFELARNNDRASRQNIRHKKRSTEKLEKTKKKPIGAKGSEVNINNMTLTSYLDQYGDIFYSRNANIKPQSESPLSIQSQSIANKTNINTTFTSKIEIIDDRQLPKWEDQADIVKDMQKFENIGLEGKDQVDEDDSDYENSSGGYN